jgi:hypothetical protein
MSPRQPWSYRYVNKKKEEEAKLDAQIDELLESDEEPQDSILGSEDGDE